MVLLLCVNHWQVLQDPYDDPTDDPSNDPSGDSYGESVIGWIDWVQIAIYGSGIMSKPLAAPVGSL